jgi:hypothetical protein
VIILKYAFKAHILNIHNLNTNLNYLSSKYYQCLRYLCLFAYSGVQLILCCVWTGFEITTLVVIGTDCTGSCKSNYHTFTTTTAPNTSLHVSVPDECYSRKAPCLLIHISTLIRVITKLPSSEQSSKGKVKTHKYINRQNQSTTGRLRKP